MTEFNDLYLAPVTKSLIDGYLKHPKQGILLAGDSGTGLGTLAKCLALKQCNHPTDIVLVEPDEKGTISIERVRKLYVDTRNVRKNTQIVVVDDADTMSHDAQNAFLKLLEEPGSQVRFILTSHQPESLLATVTSRVQTIVVKPVSESDSQRLANALGVKDPGQLQQILFLASGLPAELTRLVANRDYFDSQALVVRQARDFLGAQVFDRLATVSKLTRREDALLFVKTLARLIDFSSQKNHSMLEGDIVSNIEKTTKRLLSNGNVRAQLMYLALHI